MSKILYTAVVLDKKSQKSLTDTFSNVIPDRWKVFCHHMTIAFKEGLPSYMPNSVGDQVTLTVTHLGLSTKAMAVKVTGVQSKNKIPHITVAVNVKNGGNPVDSNSIKNWKPISNFTVNGVIAEITK